MVLTDGVTTTGYMTVFTLWSTKVYTECDASQPPTLR